MLKVTKFGGSSLASAQQMAKVGAIIRSDPDRKFIIPSAPGKRYSDDTKVTDMLYRRISVRTSERSRPGIRRLSTACVLICRWRKSLP